MKNRNLLLIVVSVLSIILLNPTSYHSNTTLSNPYTTTQRSQLPTFHSTDNSSWTFLIYYCADNNLEPFAVESINAMELIGSTQNVTILCLVDFYNGASGPTSGAICYNITYDTDENIINSEIVTTPLPVEPNMADKQILYDFVLFGQNYAPADHYALLLFNHGDGTYGLNFDDTSNDHMSVQDLGEALTATDIVHLDLLVFDMCLMGQLEIAYEVCHAVDFVVSTQEIMPMEGIPWETIFPHIVANPSINSSDVSQLIVSKFKEAYAEGGIYHIPGFGLPCLSAINTFYIEDVVDRLDIFASALLTDEVFNENFELLCKVRAQTQGFRFYSHLMDLGDFAQNAVAILQNATLKSLAQSLYDSVIAAIHYEEHLWLLPNATGISICFNSYLYKNNLTLNTSWDELMVKFITVGSTSSLSRIITETGEYFGYLDWDRDIFYFEIESNIDGLWNFTLEDVKADWCYRRDFDLYLYNSDSHLLASSRQTGLFESIVFPLEKGNSYYLIAICKDDLESEGNSGVFKLYVEIEEHLPTNQTSLSFILHVVTLMGFGVFIRSLIYLTGRRRR